MRQYKLRTIGSLTVYVVGVELSMVRDAATKTATLVQRGEVDPVLGVVGEAALSTARQLLKLRAERFLGSEWKIVG